jgi:hypothetical protein
LALAVIGYVRHEPRRALIGGAVLGGAAVALQFAVMVVLGLVGALILVGVMKALTPWAD